jgi:hypothetical protein
MRCNTHSVGTTPPDNEKTEANTMPNKWVFVKPLFLRCNAGLRASADWIQVVYRGSSFRTIGNYCRGYFYLRDNRFGLLIVNLVGVEDLFGDEFELGDRSFFQSAVKAGLIAIVALA